MNTTAICEAGVGSGDPLVALAEALLDAGEAELDERIRSLELERRRVEAELAMTVAAAEQRQVFLADGHRSMKGYLRATCNWSNPDVASTRQLSRAVDGVPGLAEALHDGRIGLAQARAIARVHGNPRVRDRLIEFAPILLDIAERYSYDDFRIALQRFEMLADTEGAHRDRDEQIASRNAHVMSVGGTLHLDAAGGDPLINDEMEAIFRRFCEHEFRKDAAARREMYGDNAADQPLPRTGAQRNYDAFVEAMRRANADLDRTAEAPRTPGPLVNVVVDHRTWGMILADAGLVPTSNLHGEPVDPFTGLYPELLDGILADADAFATMRCETSNGTVLHPHDVLRATLAGHVRRVVVDAHSVAIDLGRKQRLFTGAAREAAKLLVRRCDHAGCDLPADFCDVDHITEWTDGGPTDQRNAGVACGHHNRWKHRRRFTSRRDDTGRAHTIRPDGTIVLPVGARPPTFPNESDDTDDDGPEFTDIEIAEMTRRIRERARALPKRTWPDPKPA